MSKFYYFFIFSLIFASSYSQPHLFIKSDAEIPLFTEQALHQIPLLINTSYFSSIKENKPCDILLNVPFFQNSAIDLTLEAFNVFTDDFQLFRSTEDGFLYDNYQPDIQSYRIIGENISGSISFMKDVLIGVIKYNGNVYEVTHIEDNLYVLFDVNQSIANSDFSCQTVTENVIIQNNQSEFSLQEGGAECVEMAIEIDYYTYNQFDNNCYDAVEWSLALLAGVSEVYMSELDEMVFLQARYINVWEIPDDYDPFNDCGDMLNQMPNYWTNPPFNQIYAQADLVHLFSRKNANGGIAWVGALCQGSFGGEYGFGVTTGLNTTLTYSYPTNIPYSYNLSYLGHEIGHNFGANHTHWCGWDSDASLNFPGGAIDACETVEGNCSSPDNPPNEIWQQSSGTIMSYCDFNIGITLEFHPVVESQALIPGITNANCFSSDCDDLETSCNNSIYGCTDSIAENYNPQANINDNSCEYIYGCTSMNADNYNPNATQDDGSCICLGQIDLYLETDYYSNETGWELLNANGNIVASVEIGDYIQGGEIILNTYCLAEGCYEFNIYDDWGDGLSSNNTAGNTPNYYIFFNDEYLVQMDNVDFGFESLNPFCLEICSSDDDNDGVCDEDEIYGCTDSSYLEYNALATEDDSSCLTLIIEGCTDVDACNYNSNANLDNNTCEYPAFGLDCDENCLSDINLDGICDVFGCINSDACNYNSTANIDDDSCEYPLFNFDCSGTCLVTIDCFGECGGSAIFDNCGVCNGDNDTCLGCTDNTACNFNPSAILSDDSCEYPLVNFNCNGDCLLTVDCAGDCGGDAIVDECGDCGGSGPDLFYDCDGYCLFDLDGDGVCDQLDNCLEDYNPSQIDNDNDGYGDECSCRYVDINGSIIVESGSYEVYTLSNNIENMASWEIVGGTIVWNSATEPSIGVQWLEEGQGSISIIQYFGLNEMCTISLDVTILPSTISLQEDLDLPYSILMVTDILGRSINLNNKNAGTYILNIYNDGSVKKIYQIKK